MEEVLRDLDSDERCRENYLLVKLNGLLHTDDRLALLDIALQLDVDQDVLEGAKVREPFCCLIFVYFVVVMGRVGMK